MLTVDDYGAIRRARRDGKSIRQIAIEFKHSRNTIRKILKQSEPKLVPSTRNRPAPILGPFQPIIDQILLDDETAPPKQRHTAANCVVAFATNMATAAAMPRCNVTCSSTDSDIKKPSSPWRIFQGTGSRRISATSTSSSLTAAGSSPFL